MKCEKCNVDMKEGRITGQHPFELGADGRTNITINIPTGQEESFLGLKYEKEEKYELKAYICPVCKKIEFYLKDSD